jgi:hypothetical protein
MPPLGRATASPGVRAGAASSTARRERRCSVASGMHSITTPRRAERPHPCCALRGVLYWGFLQCPALACMVLGTCATSHTSSLCFNKPAYQRASKAVLLAPSSHYQSVECVARQDRSLSSFRLLRLSSPGRTVGLSHAAPLATLHAPPDCLDERIRPFLATTAAISHSKSASAPEAHHIVAPLEHPCVR